MGYRQERRPLTLPGRHPSSPVTTVQSWVPLRSELRA